jgi:uncharacterized protein YggU (UPF0235/DUF167 family)
MFSGAWTDQTGTRRPVVRLPAPPEGGKPYSVARAAIAAAFGLLNGPGAVTAGAKTRLKALSLKSSDAAALTARVGALGEDRS